MKHRTCEVCGEIFAVKPKQGMRKICGKPECVTAKRRATRSGIKKGGVGSPIRNCVECGKPFPANRNLVCCSSECLLAKRRHRYREDYYRRKAADPNFVRLANQRKRERMKNDPEYAEKVREYYREKQRRKSERLRTDPEYAQAERERARAWYAANAERVQAERLNRLKAKFATMTDEEMKVYRERFSGYTRKHRSKPENAARYQAYQMELNRRRSEKKMADRLAYEIAVAEAALAGVPLETIIPHRECVICQKRFIPKHPSRKTCSRECRIARHKQHMRDSLARRGKLVPETKNCTECGQEFRTKNNRITCSVECKEYRRSKQRKRNQ